MRTMEDTNMSTGKPCYRGAMCKFNVRVENHFAIKKGTIPKEYWRMYVWGCEGLGGRAGSMVLGSLCSDDTI